MFSKHNGAHLHYLKTPSKTQVIRVKCDFNHDCMLVVPNVRKEVIHTTKCDVSIPYGNAVKKKHFLSDD